jgi:RNA polymerase sigma-70 factor (ECF subfamily)
MFRFSRNKKPLRSDQELLGDYRENGNLELLGELYDRYVHVVYGTCLKYLKDREESRDAVMQLFEKIVVELKEREVRNFQTWMYVVARNYCLMQLRNSGRIKKTDGYETYSLPGFMDSEDPLHPLSDMTTEGPNEKLEKCMEELSDNQKKCISLFYYEEKCYEEIAGITGYEIKKVKSYLQNGRRNLKNCLEIHHVKRTEP